MNTTNPAVAAAQALKLATEALFNAFEVLAESLTQNGAESPAPEKSKTSKAKADSAPEPAPEPVETKTKFEAIPEAVTEEGATEEQILAILSQVVAAGNRDRVGALLKKLGYKKFSEIPEGLYDQVLPMARELLDA